VEVLHLPNLCLAVLVLFYSLNLAPMLFETFTSDRTWASHPPESFYMFQGQYGHKTAFYWRVVSPLALLCFVLSLILNRHLFERELWLSAALVLYLAVQISTMAYFVPEQEGLTSNAGLSREVLMARTGRWIFRNYFRNIAGVLAFVFILAAVFEA
jgi:di/tricarboxylate transporter